jgi:hypothetical protein
MEEIKTLDLRGILEHECQPLCRHSLGAPIVGGFLLTLFMHSVGVVVHILKKVCTLLIRHKAG